MENKIFITSDLHLQHENIRFYSPKYRSQYKTKEEMTEGIIENYNNIVSPHDRCYILGDLFMGPKSEHLNLLNRLNGHIYVTFGNHDFYLKKLHKKNKLPIEKITVLPEIYCINLIGQDFVFCHYPIEDWPGRKGHSKNESRNSVHCHGHTHGKLGSPNLWDSEGRSHRWDVGWDCWGKPMPIEFFALASESEQK